MQEKAYKIIFNAGIARTLLKMGVPMYDIKADRTNPDKTLFIFKKDEKFDQAFADINNKIAEKKEQTE